MTGSNARVAIRIAARAIFFCAVASCTDRAPAGVATTVFFQTDSGQPHFGAAMVAPLDARALANLDRDRSAADDWQRILAVHAGDTAGLPMLGKYAVANDTLRFEPSFPPVRGTTYSARFDGSAYNKLTGRVALPTTASASWTRGVASGVPTTSVVEVYPTADSLPMNLLRMYVQFSAPMTVGDDAEKHVRLLDEHGEVVDKAFLIAAGGQELWDGEHTRLTIFFDPGRIKRDLTPHEALGLPLRAGNSYTLIVDTTMRDANGLSLARGFTKRFKVGSMDRSLPRVSAWRVNAPTAGSLEPLTIDLPEPLDHALLGRMLIVKRTNGISNTAVAGRAAAGNGDRRWSFTPSEPWAQANYYLEVDSELEDLAGNNMKHLFDVMPGDTAARGVSEATVRIPFAPVARAARP